MRCLRNMEELAKNEDTPTARPAFKQSAQTWYIGGRKGSSIEGMIDEVGVFSEALGDEDLTRLMEQGMDVALFGAPVSPQGKLATAWGSLKGRWKDCRGICELRKRRRQS